jgi:hypothetical protein
MANFVGKKLPCPNFLFANGIYKVPPKFQQWKRYVLFQFGWLGCQKYAMLKS